MDTPAIADDGLYQVHVMWLDGISLDARVHDPANKRYIENKRSTQVHSRGWESIGAACVDARVSMIADGNYQKIPTSEKAMIVTRQQSWMLLDHEQGKLPLGATPPVLPQEPTRLRPGQSKKKCSHKDQQRHKQTQTRSTSETSTSETRQTCHPHDQAQAYQWTAYKQGPGKQHRWCVYPPTIHPYNSCSGSSSCVSTSDGHTTLLSRLLVTYHHHRELG